MKVSIITGWDQKKGPQLGQHEFLFWIQGRVDRGSARGGGWWASVYTGMGTHPVAGPCRHMPREGGNGGHP